VPGLRVLRPSLEDVYLSMIDGYEAGFAATSESPALEGAR
jgi:hypothetical protein